MSITTAPPATAPLPPAAPAPSARHRLRTLRPALAVVAFALAVTGLAYLVRSPGETASPYVEFGLSDAQAVATEPLPAVGPVGIALADSATQATIDRLAVITAGPSASPDQLALLARLLLQRAAVTGDSDTYSRAITALDRALVLAPDSLAIRAQRASARITTHDFGGAASDAARVLAVQPNDPAGLGAAYDAAFETGEYARAGAALAVLTRLAPAAPPVLFRQARWAALHGDTAGAAGLAAQARTAAIAAGAAGTARATYDLAAGKLAIDEGRYAAAIGAYESALAAAPGWHAALAGLGRARAASGDLVGAEQALAMAADAVPLPDTLSSLGDIRTALGDTQGAELAYGTVDVVGRLEAVRRTYNRAIVLSRADRGVDTVAAVADARSELAIRHDVYGYDALAWALLADGRPRLALAAADSSLVLGTRDPRLLAHAGLVNAAAGRPDRARELLGRAIALSPTLDPVLMERVRTALAALPAGATS